MDGHQEIRGKASLIQTPGTFKHNEHGCALKVLGMPKLSSEYGTSNNFKHLKVMLILDYRNT